MKTVAITLALLLALTAPLFRETSASPEAAEPASVAGTVLELTDDTMLLDTSDLGQVLVHLTEDTIWEGTPPAVGAYVHVDHRGAMTMSLPPQLTALRVGCYAFTGEVTEIGDGDFLLKTDDDLYQVNAEAERLAGLTAGDRVTVYSNGMTTMSLPPQIYGEVIVAEAN